MTTIAHPAPRTDRGKSRDCGCGYGGNGGGNGHGNGHGTRNDHKDCSCGCTCENRCCDLDCLVRPNFFCGQLLTDADLKALVDWTRSRLSLSRFRHGWGVVCGLEVTCSDEGGCRPCGASDHGAKVWVNPGYAIDCCGNDLVVCEPCAVDLSRFCAPEDDPCADPTRVRTLPAAEADADEGEDDADELDRGQDCFRRGDLLVVDLSLRYDEKLSHGQRAMFRGDCSEVSGCEYGRVRERPCVHAELGELGECAEDRTGEVEAWSKAIVDEVVAEIRPLIATGISITRIIRHLREHPPHSLCFIEEWLCCLLRGKDVRAEDRTASRALTGAERTRLAWWLWADRILHLTRCGCSPCSTDRGVPIARVLLKKVKGRAGYRCQVMMIDEGSSSRRPLTLECRPTAVGHLDLAPYLWHPRQEVAARLRAEGMEVADADVKARTWDEGVKNVIWSAQRGWTIQFLSAKDPVDCDRVIGFKRRFEP